MDFKITTKIPVKWAWAKNKLNAIPIQRNISQKIRKTPDNATSHAFLLPFL
jgi:hypothetical protein